MAKENKRKLLFTTAILTILLFSSAYAVLTPNAQAAETPIQGENPVSIPSVNVTTSAIQEKGLSIISRVLSLDLARYDAASKEGPQDLYMGVVPEENVQFILQSNDSKLSMLYTFANGNLRMINVLESEGTPHMTKLATKSLQLENTTLQVIDVLETAKGFLSDYQSFSDKAFYGELRLMLENVDAEENLTKTTGNLKLEVAASDGLTTFKWTYTSNGIDAPDKCVAIGYKNGFLKYFIDNWDLYKIGSTNVNLSEKEAIEIAMESARAFSWKMSTDNDTVRIANFRVTNAMIWESVFASNLYADKARSADPLMLYPVRHVWVSLDKYYPGNVYGIEVYIWADTKDVAHIQERFSTLDPSPEMVASTDDYTVLPSTGQLSVDTAESSSIPLAWIALPASAAIMLLVSPVGLLLCHKKKPHKGFRNMGTLLLCVLVSSTIAFAPISTVSAEPTRGALIFGSRSDGAMTNPPNSYHWRKTADELTRQGITSNAIKNYFRDDGYDAENNQGYPGSIRANVLDKIDITADQHSLVAIVDFDHGVGDTQPGDGFHFMFEDNNGSKKGPPPGTNATYPNGRIYDFEVRSITDDYPPSKYFFSFINTCLSANTTNPYTGQDWQGLMGGSNRSLPFGFTGLKVHPTPNCNPPSGNMSRNGYTYPDSGAFAYMGFPSGSAALAQTIKGISPIYATWLEKFFWYALSFDISVNNALDEATLYNFNSLFGTSALATGFTASWPMDTDGNGIWEPNLGPGSTLVLYGNGNIHLYQYFIHDYTSATGIGSWGIQYPDNIEGGSNDGQYTHMYAYYTPYGPSQAVIVGSIGWEATGHIYLYGYTSITSYIQVWVSYDGSSNWYSVNTLTVTQPSPQWIDIGSYSNKFRYIAVVVYPQGNIYVDSVLVIPSTWPSPHYWVSNIESANPIGSGSVTNPSGLVHSYNDGSYVRLYGGNSGDGGEIVGNMTRDTAGNAHGHIYLWGYSGTGYTSCLYVYVASNSGGPWYSPSIVYQLVSPGSARWIDCGSYAGNFKYIKIKAIYQSGYSANLFVDSVKVVP